VPSADRRDIGAGEHLVQFYEADAFCLDTVADFIGTSLRTGDAAVVVATQAHRDALDERLQTSGLDIADASARGAYVSLDAAETLSRIMADDMPDRDRLQAVLGDVILRAADDHLRVCVFGEMVASLVLDGCHTAALRLEQLWNELQQRHAFSLICAYPIDGFGGEALAAVLHGVCAEHSRVIPAESYTELPTADDRFRAIAVLQQKAISLEAEVTERQRTEERLRVALASESAARREAEAALRVRDEFLAVAAHELRTPLTTLTGQAQLALRQIARGSPAPERTTRSLEAIAGQAHKLSRLVSQLLDISRIDADKLLLERQPADLAVLVGQVVSGAREQSARHGILLRSPGLIEAQVDPLRIEQVLTNLLDNAVKFSPDGGTIEVALAPLGRTAVELSVRDHGLGIPPERRGEIFNRFYQAHATSHRSGMGLGLYISRQIVELHGGDISAEFPPDGGTRFIVRLPLFGHSELERVERPRESLASAD
jgi:signal transduction histidine kinase